VKSQVSAEQKRALPHAEEPERTWRERFFRRDAAAVIADPEQEPIGDAAHRDAHMVGLCVPLDITQHLLKHPKHGRRAAHVKGLDVGRARESTPQARSARE
jgi:hypothetical protein